jgi:hypothetical protein
MCTVLQETYAIVHLINMFNINILFYILETKKMSCEWLYLCSDLDMNPK